MKLERLWGPHLVDLFASPERHHLPRFVFPSLEPHPVDFEDTSSPLPTSDTHHSQLAISTLVPASPTVSRVATNATTSPNPGRKQSRATYLDEEQGMDSSSLESSVKQIRLSESALGIINPSGSASKPQHYIQTTFIDWCAVQNIDPFTPSVSTVLNFLAENKSLKKWKTSTTLTYASVVLQLFSTYDQQSIRQSDEYVKFCKNLKANTILPLKSWDFDIKPTLEHVLSLGPNDYLPPDLLTAKTAWLLSMVGFLRPSDAERIDLNQCSVSQCLILKLVVVILKEKCSGTRITKAITIHPHQNALLCPVLAYQSYRLQIANSETLTPHPIFPGIISNALFWRINQASVAIGHERISKHIQSIMQFVSRPPGAPIPKVLALGSTLATQSGITVDDIIVQGNWSSKELFEQFYRISVTTSSDFTKVLTLNSQQRSQSSKCNIM
ncbi:hypothetical protein RO3G_08694 [Rhizopus delemar RA 99-880]|uniref:Tyr recombinase domain-containing protein n=1 Tax=Rhizopus delemar (strain RA 99-880 / ATCC MYA-4621 / FGSC 9543 / NRRL 43880) TaxID=246409 RepID=I1C6A9_RHIO9|nr:hypothetical protein RO3G_08694 [Rhizopus delemar RA 99-880]|eukprot:EIE83989.1 hypothetical protein RO3G_08694 [Rhizopus delemar RA 99-880]